MSNQEKKWVFIVGACFAIFLGLILIFTASGVPENRELAAESNNWPTTEGIIITSEIAIMDNETGWWNWNLSYNYSVNGKAYSGHRYEFRTEDIDRDTVERYRKGKKVSVYYKPDDPNTAVLVPGNSNFDPNKELKDIWKGIFLLGTGLFILVFFNIDWFTNFLRKTTDLTN